MILCTCIHYCEKIFETTSENRFWSIRNSGNILKKLISNDFQDFSVSIYDFSTLNSSLTSLIEETLSGEK